MCCPKRCLQGKKCRVRPRACVHCMTAWCTVARISNPSAYQKHIGTTRPTRDRLTKRINGSVCTSSISTYHGVYSLKQQLTQFLPYNVILQGQGPSLGVLSTPSGIYERECQFLSPRGAWTRPKTARCRSSYSYVRLDGCTPFSFFFFPFVSFQNERFKGEPE